MSYSNLSSKYTLFIKNPNNQSNANYDCTPFFFCSFFLSLNILVLNNLECLTACFSLLFTLCFINLFQFYGYFYNCSTLLRNKSTLHKSSDLTSSGLINLSTSDFALLQSRLSILLDNSVFTNSLSKFGMFFPLYGPI